MTAAEVGRAVRSRLVRAAGVAGVLGALALLGPAVAGAATIHVRDNQPNAIQRAIDDAGNGDTLKIHRGRYAGGVVVDKRLRLVGVSDQRPVVDGNCSDFNVIAARHNGVVLRHLKVVGASTAGNEVDYRFLKNGLAKNLRVRDTCGGLNGAEYGINLFFAPGVDVIGNKAGPGFTDAGIYVGDIHEAGVVEVRRNEAFRNNVGIIVEFSEPPGHIRTVNNNAHDNEILGENPATGIYVFGSVGMFFARNRIVDSGQRGVWLTSNSNFNVFNDNVFKRNPTHVLDQGNGNCGSGNHPSSVFDPC